MNTCSKMNTHIVHTPYVLIWFIVLIWKFFWTGNHNDGCETTVNPLFDIQEICIIGCELLLWTAECDSTSVT